MKITKRLGALLLALITLLAAWPAGAECAHKNRKYEITETVETGKTSATQHEYFLCEHYTCVDCGEKLYIDLPKRYWEPHSFDSTGDCDVCGYWKPLCDHNKTKEKIKSETASPLDAQRHMITYNIQIVCADCNKIMSTRTDQREAAHSFAATAMSGKTVQYCAPCGYNSVCGTDGHDWDEETYITENGDRATRCLFCGKIKIIDTKAMIDALDDAIRDGGMAILRDSNATYSSFTTVYNTAHRLKIRAFAEDNAAKFYTAIAGDISDVAMRDTVEGIFLYDKLMTRMAGDEGWKDIDIGMLENLLSLLGVSEDLLNNMAKAKKMGGLLTGKKSFSSDDLKEIFESPELSEKLAPIILVKNYAETLINILTKCQRYYVAYQNMGDSVDVFVETLQDSGMTAVASLLRDCKSPMALIRSVLALEISSGLDLSDTVRDGIMKLLPGALAPLAISYKASTALNEVLFNTTDTLAAGYREYWAMEAALDTRYRVSEEFGKLCVAPEQDQYNRLLAAYLINSTFISATFGGTANFIRETSSGVIGTLFASQKDKTAMTMYETLANLSGALNLDDFEGDSTVSATVTGNTINIRAAANKDSKKIGYAKKGEKFECIDVDPETGWVVVLMENGRIGYIAPSLVSVE